MKGTVVTVVNTCEFIGEFERLTFSPQVSFIRALCTIRRIMAHHGYDREMAYTFDDNPMNLAVEWKNKDGDIITITFCDE